MRLFKNPAKDAKKIQDTIDYRVLKAAWDSSASINIGSKSSTHKVATPAWFALFSIQNYKGDFKKFHTDDLHLLKALTSVNIAYNEIIALLQDHSRNEELGRHILQTNPILNEIVPQEYRNALKINEYLVAVIKQYQMLLASFYKKYQPQIDSAVEQIEKVAASKEYDLLEAKVKMSDAIQKGSQKTED